jgi:hypothetical protein
MFRRLRNYAVIASFFFVVCGCATVKMDMHSTGAGSPVLGSSSAADKVLVLWGTAWRSNQKEAGRREEIAAAGIAEFFNDKAVVRKTIGGKSATLLSDSQIFQSEELKTSHFERVIVLRIEELGPILTFHLSPILWNGSTDVSLHVRVLDRPSISLISEIGVHWEKGGAFEVRGASKLKEGLKSALASIFL